MSLLLTSLIALASAPTTCPLSASEECTNAEVVAHIDSSASAVADRASKCLYDTEAQCTVMASGEINTNENFPDVAWQKLSLIGPYGLDEMVIAFDISGAEPKLIGQGQSTGTMKSPELYSPGDGTMLLHAAGTREGTGSANADMLFAYKDGKWRQIDVQSWRDDVDKWLPKGFGIWKGVNYNFDELFAYSPVWREDDANCCATGGDAFISFRIDGDRLVIDDLTFNETMPVKREEAQNNTALPMTDRTITSTRLACPVEQAVYSNQIDPSWEISFVKPKHRPTAASDLLLMITGSAFVRDFAFTQSQGFGNIYLLVAEDDEEAGQPMPMPEQPVDGLAFHGFEFGDRDGDLVRIVDAPSAGEGAPIAIYLPEVAQYFWYDEKYVDPETGETLPDAVDMPQVMFVGECLDQAE